MQLEQNAENPRFPCRDTNLAIVVLLSPLSLTLKGSRGPLQQLGEGVCNPSISVALCYRTTFAHPFKPVKYTHRSVSAAVASAGKSTMACLSQEPAPEV